MPRDLRGPGRSGLSIREINMPPVVVHLRWRLDIQALCNRARGEDWSLFAAGNCHRVSLGDFSRKPQAPASTPLDPLWFLGYLFRGSGPEEPSRTESARGVR